MALTRKALKAMGLTDEQVDSIVEMHAETVDGLKETLKRAEAGTKELPELQKKVETLESELAAAKKDGWKEKHNTVKKEFDEYKAEIAAKELKSAKEKAVRAYLESKRISGKNLEIAMKALHTEIAAVELEGENIKDKKPLDDAITDYLSGLVTTTTVQGAPPPANPPVNIGVATSRADLYKKDDQGRYVLSTTERQAALAKILQENNR